MKFASRSSKSADKRTATLGFMRVRVCRMEVPPSACVGTSRTSRVWKDALIAATNAKHPLSDRASIRFKQTLKYDTCACRRP
jgi:predicted NAD/FAD-binding protein